MRAAEALGKINDNRATDQLILALKDNDSRVRCNAAWSLGYIKDPRAVDPLIRALKDNDTIRRTVVESLGWIGDERAADPLIQALNDNEINVRQTAAWSLGKINNF